MPKFIQFDVDNKVAARYDSEIHGARALTILDPAWVRPTIQVPHDDGNGGTVMVDGPDETAVHPTITIPNPDCKIPTDAVEVSEALFFQTINETDGVWKRDPATGDIAKHPFPPPSADQIITSFTNEIQRRLDDFARTRGYDGILSACTYATSTVPAFHAEGQYCVEARDSTWATAYGILNAVQSGQRPMPTLAEVLAELPALAWPV